MNKMFTGEKILLLNKVGKPTMPKVSAFLISKGIIVKEKVTLQKFVGVKEVPRLKPMM